MAGTEITSPSPSAVQGLSARLPATLRGMAQRLDGLIAQPAVRRAAPMLLVLAVAALGLLAWIALREPARVPLAVGASEAERAQIVETLTADGMPHRLDPATGAVEVLRQDYHRARLVLAGAGLAPAAADGYAALDSLPMGASRSIEATRLRQAHELELARSIGELAAVQAARVHLAVPERSAFLRDSLPPRASVFLTLRPGRSLDPVQVSAVVNLVASSVPGLAREAVTVVDQTGRLLSQGAGDPDTVADDRALQTRLRIEELYRQRVESVLMPLTGPTGLAVQVTVEMDFTRAERTEERVDPDAIALRSEQESLDESSAPAARGIPGAVSNTPPDAATLSDTPEGTDAPPRVNRAQSATRNYEVSRTVETVVSPGVRIARVHAAVLVDAPASPPEGQPATPLPEAEMRRLIEAAIGFDPARGDSISLSALPFAPPLTGEGGGWTEAAWWPDLLRHAGTVALVALIVLGVVRPLLTRMLAQGPGPGALAMTPTERPAGLIEVREGETLTELRQRLHPQGATGRLTTGYSFEEKVALARQLADEDSDRVAAVFGAMIRDDLDVVN